MPNTASAEEVELRRQVVLHPPRPADVTEWAPALQAPTVPGQVGGFWDSLFDFSFSSFITPALAKALYGVQVVVICLSAAGLVLLGFSVGSGPAQMVLFLAAPLYFLIAIVASRLFSEGMILLSRIEEHLAAIARQTRDPL